MRWETADGDIECSRAIADIVPPHVLERRKLGFPVPTRHWLAGPEMYDWARETIEKSQTDYLLNKQPILDMLDEHRAGRAEQQEPEQRREPAAQRTAHHHARQLVGCGLLFEQRLFGALFATEDQKATMRSRWAGQSSSAISTATACGS